MGAIGQATNELGKLFVDIGVGNLGQTLKALNSVSATFLLTKNAASQLVKPIVDMGIQTVNSAVGIGKMAAALGTTKLNAQKLQYYLKDKGVEGLENDIAKLQKMYADYALKVGGISVQFAYALERIGLKWKDYSGSFEDTLKLIQDIKNSKEFQSYNQTEQLALLNQLGLSGGWKYLFEQKDFNLNDALAITDDTIQKEIELAQAINQLKNKIDELKKLVIEKIINAGVLDKLGSVINKLDYWLKTPGSLKNDVKNSLGIKPLTPVTSTKYTVKTMPEKTGNPTKDKLNALLYSPLAPGSNIVPSSLNISNVSDAVPTGQLTPQGNHITLKQDIHNERDDNIKIETEDIPELNNNTIFTLSDTANGITK